MQLENSKWPKNVIELSSEQEIIREQFIKKWLEVLPNKFGIIELFNHKYPLKTYFKGARTLEIGAGIGAHLHFENLQNQEYVVMELRHDLIKELEVNFPSIKAICGDCQKRINFPDEYFDRVLAIHILEHLPDLPSAIKEIKRVIKSDGRLSVLIPCDPGFLYSIARSLSAKRLFEQQFHQSYDWFIRSEHINTPDEIIIELNKHFLVKRSSYFPLSLPFKKCNLVIGLTLEKKITTSVTL